MPKNDPSDRAKAGKLDPDADFDSQQWDEVPPPGDDDAPNAGPRAPDGPDVSPRAEPRWRQAKEPTPPDPLAPWHVAAVLAAMLDPDKPEPVPVAPLPGGYGTGAYVEARAAAELEPESPVYGPIGEPLEPGRWPALAGLLRAWFPDTLAVLVGHTGRGKSSLAVQVAERAARAGAPVLYASLEMSAEELVARLLALRGSPGASWSALKRGAYPLAAVAAAGARLVEACPHLYLWAPDSKDRNPDALQRMARAVSAVAGNRPPLVVLDYVQRLAPPDKEDRRLAVSDLSGRLRDLSRPGGMVVGWPGATVLALSSTARAGYANFASTADMRMASDLEGSGKESGELEYDAPVLLCMTSDMPGDGEDEPTEGRMALVRLVKNREGRPGSAWMRFEAARGRFVETDAPPLPEKSNTPKGPDPGRLALSLKAADNRRERALLNAAGVRDKAVLAAVGNETKIKAAHSEYDRACLQARAVLEQQQEQARGRQEARAGSSENGGSKRGIRESPKADTWRPK